MREILDTHTFTETQYINHFRDHSEITRKDMLAKNLKRMRHDLKGHGQMQYVNQLMFFPETYVLPVEFGMLKQRMLEVQKSGEQGVVWIMKPCGKSQGKGIFMITKLSELNAWWQTVSAPVNVATIMAEASPLDSPAGQSPVMGYNNQLQPSLTTTGSTQTAQTTPIVGSDQYVCQRYIGNPYLIGGRKFDMRIYVLVTSYKPLRVFICRYGFARFTFQRYKLDSTSITDASVHLTNVAIQKHTEAYATAGDGCKWKLTNLRQYLEARHGKESSDRAFWLLERNIVRNLQAVSDKISQKRVKQHDCCFEMYGYDFLFDKTLFPWIIEVNGFPSMTADTEDDAQLKRSVLHDMLTIVDMENRGVADVLWRPDAEKVYLKAHKKELGSIIDPLESTGPLAYVEGISNYHNKEYLGLENNNRGLKKVNYKTSYSIPQPTQGTGITQVGCWDMVFFEPTIYLAPGTTALDRSLDEGWIQPGICHLGCEPDRTRNLKELAELLERRIKELK